MTNKTYSFSEENFNSFKGFVEHGIMDEFIDDLVYEYVSKDLTATPEQEADLEYQFLQALAQKENKSFEEVKSYYKSVNRENELRISAEMEPEIEAEINCLMEKNKLEKELDELRAMAASLNAKMALKCVEIEMKEAEWKAL